MATQALTFYFLNRACDSGTNHMAMLQYGAPSSASTATGWTVGTVAADNYSSLDALSKRGTGDFGTTARPTGSIDNDLGDCFCSDAPLTGQFAEGAWDFSFDLICTVSGGQDGAIRFQMWKGSDKTGANATEIGTVVQCSEVVNLIMGVPAQSTDSSSFAPGALAFVNEYLFCQIAWRITGASSNAAADVLLRTGGNSRIVTPNWTPLEDTRAIALGGNSGG
jgi:hypothetical protein